MAQFVEVVFNRPLWQSFTYSVPEELSSGDMNGCRVVAPFGNSSLVGYVWKTGMTPPSSGMEVKRIQDRLDALPLLSGELLDLVRWATDYYCAPPGMMMSAAHPPGNSGRAQRVVETTGEPNPSHPISRLVPDKGTVTVKLIREKLGKDYPLDRELASLESAGSVRVFWESASQPRKIRERMIEAVHQQEKLVRMAEAIRNRAPRQAELLVYLATAGEPVPRMQLLKSTGSSASSLNSLLEKGILKETLVRKFREPLMRTDMDNMANAPDLNVQQQLALDSVSGSLSENTVFLLHGVTGSGKTEVYLRIIDKVLKQGGSALVMVPEISLTPLTVSRFNGRFPGQVAVLHSGMSPGERLDSWNLIRSGRRKIAIGPRSAVFAPLQNLGVIVVDEEHDGSYKQDELPHYNGRDLAIVRGKKLGIPVVLGSASPSMESYGNALSKKYRLLELSERVDGTPMPSNKIVGQPSDDSGLISGELLEEIRRVRSRGEQSIILINRRGFSPTQMCRNCGLRKECPNCGVTLTYHRRGNLLKCHYCHYWTAAMTVCPRCGFREFSHMGPGIQKVEERLQQLIPDIRIIRMDADTTRTKDSHWRILGDFARGSGDILLGTQMVAKGHDFANVTLVGIISADMGLAFPDFRAAERTFQLILQAAGRAGRGDIPGQVVLQSMDTRDPTIISAAEHDFDKFWERESAVRKLFGYPPYGYLVRFVWSGTNRERVAGAAQRTMEKFRSSDVDISEPMEAAFPRINRRWRFSAIAKSSNRGPLARAVRELRKRFDALNIPGVRLSIDIDPYNLL